MTSNTVFYKKINLSSAGQGLNIDGKGHKSKLFECKSVITSYTSVYRALGNAELRVLVRTFFPWDA